MKGLGITRVIIASSPGTVKVTSQSRSRRGTYFIRGSAVRKDVGKSKEAVKGAIADAIKELLPDNR